MKERQPQTASWILSATRFRDCRQYRNEPTHPSKESGHNRCDLSKYAQCSSRGSSELDSVTFVRSFNCKPNGLRVLWRDRPSSHGVSRAHADGVAVKRFTADGGLAVRYRLPTLGLHPTRTIRHDRRRWHSRDCLAATARQNAPSREFRRSSF